MQQWESRPTAHWVGLGVKSGLVMLLALPLLQPDLEQYEGKGMNVRILVFPLAALVIPVLWRLTGSRDPYPYLVDSLLVLTPLTDVLWNTLDLYDRVWAFDKPVHLMNSMLFAAVVGLWAARYPLGTVNRFALALGLGMTLGALWELGEYASFAAGWSDLQSYPDTIGDLTFGLVGCLLGAGIALMATQALEEEPEAEPATVLAGP